MNIVGTTVIVGIALLIGVLLTQEKRRAQALLACTSSAAVLLLLGTPAAAAIVPTVPLGTSAQYSVLGGSTVTNTGATTLAGSLGLSPGTSITGFPPGIVVPPGTTNNTNAAAAQAQSDLTAAYVNAAGRPLDATTTADLANLSLQGGVYAGPSKGALSLTGPLVLDGAGDPSTVFIFQTNSTLITGSSSTVTLINGAQECNVFWQVGSSATLGTGSVFVGNILALTSITVTSGVTVHGRALARNGAVTLDNDTFTTPTCATSLPTTPTTTPATTPTGPTAGTPSTPTGPTGSSPTAGGTPSASSPFDTPSSQVGTPTGSGTDRSTGTGTSTGTSTSLSRTGAPISTMAGIAILALGLGLLARRLSMLPRRTSRP